ncbi:MAG: helix-turn-helix transcriptional regulator [Saprospiraceae bacterium]
MNLEINIADDILSQFTSQLNGKKEGHTLILASNIGEGKISVVQFPNELAFHHFSFKLKIALPLSSTNPVDSDYLLLNINLSERAVEKTVNGQVLDLQKYLPSGILYYPPNINVTSNSPINTKFEIVLIRFHKDLLRTYFPENENAIFEIKDTIIYEDLDFQSEELLRKIVRSTNKLKSHADLLHFLSIFFDKLRSRESPKSYENIHPKDIKQLFLVASVLRNPTPKDLPTITALAKRAGMGKTKFKKIFKQVFGRAPKQYHQKIKMEYAKAALQQQQKTSTELAYELGYADPSKFTRAFKNHFGSAPSKL